jgi:predicted nucleotidyltransferase
MKACGLDSQTIQKLRQIFANYPSVRQAKLYGSRAKGTHQAHSDIDLVVLGDGLDRFVIANLLLDLDDTDIPFLIDLQNYSELRNRRLIEHIDRVGVVIYQRDQEIAENLSKADFV